MADLDDSDSGINHRNALLEIDRHVLILAFKALKAGDDALADELLEISRQIDGNV